MQNVAVLIDGMSLVQKANGDGKTFQELANNLLTSALQISTNSKHLDIVFDVYLQQSIKNAERIARCATQIVYTQISAGQKIRKYRELLGSSKSKESLIAFVFEVWQKPESQQRLGSKELYITCKEKCARVTTTEAVLCSELRSTQEEADTRLLLHAQHALQNGCHSTMIISDDTDVFLLCLAFHQIGQIYIQCGTKNSLRIVNITALGQALGQHVCKALIGLHALTGCDSVSAFSGRGKLRPLKLMLKERKFQDSLVELGKEWVVPCELFSILQEFICRMYSAQVSNIDEVNELRFQLFRLRNGNIESGQLPPCEDCLYLHMQRANYQTGVWRRSLDPNPVIPQPEVNMSVKYCKILCFNTLCFLEPTEVQRSCPQM